MLNATSSPGDSEANICQGVCQESRVIIIKSSSDQTNSGVVTDGELHSEQNKEQEMAQ